MQKTLIFLKQNSSYVIISLFFILGFGLYANSFHNQMFWDDNDGIVNNAYIKEWHNFPKFFSENLIAGSNLVSNYWRPLLLTVFSAEWHLWQGNVLGYHVINTLFHILTAVFLYFILDRIFRNKILAFVPSLLFLIHPLQTEAVTYISGLADPLSGFFSLWGVWLYLNYRDSNETKSNSAPYMLAMFMYVLALLTKDSAVVMPGMILLVEFFYKPSGQNLKDRLLLAFKRTYPFFITAVIYTMLRATSLNFQNTFNLYNEQNIYTSNFFVRLFTFFKVIATYFQLLVWPNHLHMERGITLAQSLLSPAVLLGAFLSIGSITLAVIWHKKYPVLSFGILWFFILLFPHSNLLVPTAGLLYEHWLYLPTVGFWLVIVWLVLKIFYSSGRGSEATESRSSRFAFGSLQTAILSLFLIIYSLFLANKTIVRNREWHDPITFYNQTLIYAPTSYRVINNLGMAYDDVKNFEQAKQMYERAISLDSKNSVAYHNLGNTYKALRQFELAKQNFETAIIKDPKFFFSYYALAQLYLDENNNDQAVVWLEKLAVIDPNNQTVKNYISQVKAR